MKTVILAGGKGSRLLPYTTIVPKPLMPVGEKPVLEIILEQLRSFGMEDIILTISHLGELIMAFCGDGSKFGVKIDYSWEDKPLGTVGALGLVRDDLSETFLTINGDTLTDLNFLELVNYHKRNGALVTIALKRREVHIDFGVVELDDSHLVREYIEKPVISHTVSMGVYVFEPRVLDYIPPGESLDFPDLIRRLLARGEPVGGFVCDNYWWDMGRPEDFRKANEEADGILARLGLD